jgi:hypothetical protein
MATQKLTVEAFTLKAIKVNKAQSGKAGLHTVWSGFNTAYRTYFGSDPVAATKALADKGIIASRPFKGGALLFLVEDAPELKPSTQEKAASMLELIAG